MKITSERRSGIGTVAIISVAVIVILIAGAAYYLSIAGAAKTTTTTTPSSQPKTVQVSMPNGVSSSQSLNFQPANITLVIGVNNSVMWTNSDGAPHTVTAASVPSGAVKFNSGNMNSGATFTYTFTVPGTYKYGCTYHYWMLGTVVVKQAA
jgi:plastocyanin